ncbi:MAG: site-specific integrase [Negativicutes bacterium]|nr:site-specific integrase [Negativicutes bacterium]
MQTVKPSFKTRPIGRNGDRLPRYFTADEIRAILAHCSSARKVDIYFLVNLLWRTGIRVSEAIALVAADIDPATHQIQIRSLRRRDGHVRVIPLHTDFSTEINDWIGQKQLADSDRLFPVTRKTAYNWVAWACRQAGFTDGRAHPQILRHSFAVNLLAQGMPVTIVQEFLGHTDLAETLIYTRLVHIDPRKLFESLTF